MRIIIDTNFLMIPFQFGVDIFSELERLFPEKNEFIVCEGTLNELKTIASGHSKHAPAARLALLLIKEKDIKIKPSKNMKVDEWIVEKVKSNRFAVCTNDKLLRKRLRNKALVVGLREKSHLDIVLGDYSV